MEKGGVSYDKSPSNPVTMRNNFSKYFKYFKANKTALV